jgi:hypothetical protein
MVLLAEVGRCYPEAHLEAEPRTRPIFSEEMDG